MHVSCIQYFGELIVRPTTSNRFAKRCIEIGEMIENVGAVFYLVLHVYQIEVSLHDFNFASFSTQDQGKIQR